MQVFKKELHFFLHFVVSSAQKCIFYLHISFFCSTFAPAFEKEQGKMAEWSIASVLKTEVRKRTGGSNPSLSA